jgi:hypothetical protein
LIKTTLDKYGPFAEVRVIPLQKRYYANMCSHCKNYLYLTSLECVHCHKNLCERHLSKCDCPQKEWILIIKELNADRRPLLEVVPAIESGSRQLT